MSLQSVLEQTRPFRFPGTAVRVTPKGDIASPEIVKAQPYLRPSVLGRSVCLSPLDWTRFTTALQEAFPDALYSRSVSLAELTRAAPPKLRLEHSLRLSDPQAATQMHFGPETELILKRQLGWQVASEGLFWPQITLGRPMAPLPADERGPERLREAQILIHTAPHHQGHARFARQMWRLLARFTANARVVLVRYPDYELLPQVPGASSSGLWIGHDALRWAHENPTRLLAYERSRLSPRAADVLGYGYRPAEE
ncbi:hypothetical protein FNB15_19275 [Ferrovibrio terrae]|uniref:Uncharacterized protein n=1 Tax=Ferrovibrio terrae TaxID=2594003 RepID=A0A516H666_9PROT|nr:hypothetical protein [Ferrovibrio terrae]QDO99283.1 hypothetical protein FNB15_19275 [Ferrovibrio terrae]